MALQLVYVLKNSEQRNLIVLVAVNKISHRDPLEKARKLTKGNFIVPEQVVKEMV